MYTMYTLYSTVGPGFTRMPVDATGCELFCTVVYVHVYIVTLYSWHYFYLSLPCCVRPPALRVLSLLV